MRSARYPTACISPCSCPKNAADGSGSACGSKSTASAMRWKRAGKSCPLPRSSRSKRRGFFRLLLLTAESAAPMPCFTGTKMRSLYGKRAWIRYRRRTLGGQTETCANINAGRPPCCNICPVSARMKGTRNSSGRSCRSLLPRERGVSRASRSKRRKKGTAYSARTGSRKAFSAFPFYGVPIAISGTDRIGNMPSGC